MAMARGVRASMKDRPPTARQMEVYAYLYGFTRDNGHQPTLRELMATFGVSANALVGYLRSLHAKGWLDHGDGRSRAIRFLRRPDGTPFTGFADRAGA